MNIEFNNIKYFILLKIKKNHLYTIKIYKKNIQKFIQSAFYRETMFF